MRKRVKKVNLNTTKRSHDKLLLANLFTSLLIYGKVATTETKARTLKSYVTAQVSDFAKLSESRLTKRWINSKVSTLKFQKRAADKLNMLKDDFKVTMVKLSPRKGDNAPKYEVSILNYDAKSTNESNNVAKS